MKINKLLNNFCDESIALVLDANTHFKIKIL